MKRFHVHVAVEQLEDSIRFEDPQGVKWETFLTLVEATTYGADEPAMPFAAKCEPAIPAPTARSKCCA